MKVWVLNAAWISLLTPPVLATATDGLRTIAFTGAPTPGDLSVVFDGALGAVINNRGDVAIGGDVLIDGAPRRSVWLARPGRALELVLADGQTVGGVPVNARTFRLDEQSNVAIFDYPNVWTKRPGGVLTPNVLEETPIPGADETIKHIEVLDSFKQGRIAVSAMLGPQGGFADTGAILQGSINGLLSLAVLEGDAAPGLPGTFRQFGCCDLPANDRGDLAFNASAIGPSISDQNDRGLWLRTVDGNLSLVAREGDAAPGVAGSVFGEDSVSPFTPSHVDNDGGVYFTANLVSSAAEGIAGKSLWRWRATEGLTLVASLSGPAPGVDANFSRVNAITATSTGSYSFGGFLNTGDPHVSSENDSAIWADRGAGLEVVAREGDPAPGTSAFFGNPLGNLSFNERGQAAFVSTLHGPGINETNDRGLWAQDSAGALRMIVRHGDEIDVSDDPSQPDLRTVERFSFFNFPFSGGRQHNDLGEIAFTAQFADGSSGAFVSTIAASPRPSPGDFTGNGRADLADYAVWEQQFGNYVTPYGPGDANGDGLVDIADYTIWRDHALLASANGATIPEPAMIALAAIALAIRSATSRRFECSA